MSSTDFFLNDPEDAVEEMLDGFLATHSHLVARAPGARVVVRRTPGTGVAVLTGGGSGHEPAFIGYVGEGMLDGVVVGDVFASPPVGAVLAGIRAVDRGQGVLLLIGNYSGDVMNFQMAADMARAEGIEVAWAIATDDVGAGDAVRLDQRRGVSGQVLIWKACGAAAAQGRSLAHVREVAERLNAATRTMGVALSGATVPGGAGPSFTLADGQMEIGVGHHGEKGQATVAVQPIDAVVDQLVKTIDADRPMAAGDTTFVLINGLGATPLLELYIAARRTRANLRQRGIVVHRVMVGEYFIALQMAGFSVTIATLDQDLQSLLDAPAHTPHLTWDGSVSPVEVEDSSGSSGTQPAATASDFIDTDPNSPVALTRAALLAVCEQVRSARDLLGALDADLGDGDHGISMHRTFSAVAVNLRASAATDPAALIDLVGNTALQAVGGAMGPLFGSAFLAAGSTLRNSDPGASLGTTLAAMLQAAAAAIVHRGNAKVGDKTMYDALKPAADAASAAAEIGGTAGDVAHAAAQAARDGAEGTTELIARIGRASRLGSRTLGCQDAGATSVALVLQTLASAAGRPLDRPVRTSNKTSA